MATPGGLRAQYSVIRLQEGYEHLGPFVSGLRADFDNEGVVIHADRNVVTYRSFEHGEFVVKYFRGMYLFNRLAYSLFRKSKAERSFLHSEILNAKGIETPAPVAWMDCYIAGLLMGSFFVSVFYPYDTLKKIVEKNPDDVHGRSVLYQNLADFIIRLHNAGIYHCDLSPGNVLVRPDNDHFRFALVDLNRMRFGEISRRHALKNLITMRLPAADMNLLLEELALRYGVPSQEMIKTFRRMSDRKMFWRRTRRRIRRYTIGLWERLFERRQPDRKLT